MKKMIILPFILVSYFQIYVVLQERNRIDRLWIAKSQTEITNKKQEKIVKFIKTQKKQLDLCEQ